LHLLWESCFCRDSATLPLCQMTVEATGGDWTGAQHVRCV
jgi:hypothetical protein